MIVPDFRYLEDFPDSQVTNVPYSNTASKVTEEEKPHIPKKVGIVSLTALLQKKCYYLFPELLKNDSEVQGRWVAPTRINFKLRTKV